MIEQQLSQLLARKRRELATRDVEVTNSVVDDITVVEGPDMRGVVCALEAIACAIEHLACETGALAKSTEDVSRATEDVADATKKVAHATEHIACATEEVAKATEKCCEHHKPRDCERRDRCDDGEDRPRRSSKSRGD